MQINLSRKFLQNEYRTNYSEYPVFILTVLYSRLTLKAQRFLSLLVQSTSSGVAANDVYTVFHSAMRCVQPKAAPLKMFHFQSETSISQIRSDLIFMGKQVRRASRV